MPTKLIISDTSCFIILDKIGQLPLLQQVFGSIVTTPEIAAEFSETLPEWVEIISVKDKHKQQLLELQVDNGEASAMALALESENPFLILDDHKARRLANSLNLSHTGTIGIIVAAKQKGIISEIKPLLEKIKSTNFRVSADLELQALLQANE